MKDSIFTEDVNPDTNEQVPQLVNVIAARTEDKDNEVYQKIVEAYQTPEVEKPSRRLTRRIPVRMGGRWKR